MIYARIIATFDFFQFRIVPQYSHQLDEVEEEMKLLADVSETGTVSRDRLKSIRIHYDLVHELSDCINEVFGWSSIAVVLYLFLNLVTDLNWIYWRIHNEIEIDVLRTFISLYCLLFVLHVSRHIITFHKCCRCSKYFR